MVAHLSDWARKLSFVVTARCLYLAPSMHYCYRNETNALSSLLLASSAASDDNRITNYEDLQLPPHPYGYRTTKFDWTELRQIVESNDLARLSRSVDQQRQYEMYKREMERSWKSVYDHV
jgi:Protein of unknown function (DUF3605)